jgi:hypothetical protein
LLIRIHKKPLKSLKRPLHIDLFSRMYHGADFSELVSHIHKKPLNTRALTFFKDTKTLVSLNTDF